MHFWGLGAILTVQAHTEDFSGVRKTSFAPGETIRFVTQGEPNTGVLVGWTRNGIREQELGWEGVRTDANGRAEWTRTAGPSGMGNGAFVYTIMIPVNGVAPDPQIVLNFTVGAATSTTTTGGGRTGSTDSTVSDGSARSTPNTGTTPMQCPSGMYYEPLLQTCVPIGAGNNNQTRAQVADDTNILNPCAQFGLEMATDGTGRCVIPRTTTERYSNTQQCPAGQLWNDMLGCYTPRYNNTTTGKTGGSNAGGNNTGGNNTGGNNSGGSNTGGSTTGSSLPSWLDGEIFGLPKALVIGAAALLLLKGR